MGFNALIQILISNPRKLLLIDSIGAFITAFSLSIVLAQLQEIFGVEDKILISLGLVAFVYSFISLTFYFSARSKTEHFLKIMGTLNLIYCFVTAATVYTLLETITIFGFGYFLIEGVIIIALSLIEFKAASFSITKK